MTTTNYQSILFFAIACFLFLAGCSNTPSSSSMDQQRFITPKTETLEATKKEHTANVPAPVMESLQSYDPKTGTYIFNDDADAVENLQAGTVVLFETHSLRKIKNVRKENGTFVVTTDFAKLTDYYKDANIEYSAPINWSNATAATTTMHVGQPVISMATPMLGLLTPQEEGEGISPEGEEGLHIRYEEMIKGWKVGFNLTPEAGGKLKIKLSAEKGNVCSIVAEGFISSFTSNAQILIEDGETQQFTYRNDGMEGEMEVKFAAVGLGSEIAILEIPAKIERTILVNGVIPVTLRLKANLKIYPEVAPGSSSQVSIKLKYNSSIGFSYETGHVNTFADVTGDQAEQTGDSNTATAGIAGMGVGVEFPRFEIGIFGNTIVPYLLLNTHTSSYLSTGLLDNRPCHTATCKYVVHAGLSLSFLGLGAINHDYKAFEEEKRWIAEGSHCGD
ncbi:hypothetical protein [Altibacter sp.]|uniref:hypothetical protein n=1 Tax=Altibacter sp. TaxID=2024823 RepID=UPI0025BE57A5|nr:hypothetical protein [Altibacter sp.]